MKTKFIVLPIIFTVFLSACGAAQATEAVELPPIVSENLIIAEGRVEPVRFADLSFTAGGVVGDILVQEGSQVNAGDILAQLSNVESLEAQVKQAEEALLKAEQELQASPAKTLKELADSYQAVKLAQQKLDDFSVPSDFDGLTPEQAVQKTSEKVEKARTAYEPYRGYKPTSKLVRDLEDDLDDAWADYNRAVKWMELTADLDKAIIRRDQALKDLEPIDGQTEDGAVTLSRAQFITAQANLAAAEASLRNAQIRAPFAGIIAGLDLRAGESVTPNQPVVTLADLSTWIVKTTDLTEIDVVDLEEGQAATITLDALPDSPINGKVLSVGQTYIEKQGDIVYEVTVQLEGVPTAIRWGMTAQVDFPR